jgi:hypothetical protein
MPTMLSVLRSIAQPPPGVYSTGFLGKFGAHPTE